MNEVSPAATRVLPAFRRHKAAIEASFDHARITVYAMDSLMAAISAHRESWRLHSASIRSIVELLLQESRLRVVDLEADGYPSEQRFAWGEPSPFELAVSLRSNAYLSHGTAAYLRGLLREEPSTLHVNKEQSAKDHPSGTLTQAALERAFSSRPRQSRLVFSDDAGHRFVVIAGKASNRLGVAQMKGPVGERLDVTKVERTLVDVAVRPVYAGGAPKVLEAYRAARGRMSLTRLLATLKRLAHLYPYHQAIGFYLERAGYSGSDLDVVRKLGLDFDFYLAHGMEDRDYSRQWRLYYPRGL